MNDRPLTPNQMAQMLALLEAGALGRQSARAPWNLPLCRTLVIGKLRDLGLADSATVRRLGRSWTEYWLTERGQGLARDLAEVKI